MKYLTLNALVNIQACHFSRDRFKKLFGNKARITLSNVRRFAGSNMTFYNFGFCSWMIRYLLGHAVDAETAAAFRKHANSEDYGSTSFDKRRVKALFQLLLVAKEIG